MPYYLVQVSFTKESVKALVDHPENRLEEVGVTIIEDFLAFGDYDEVLILEAPDNVRAAAVAMAVTAGGAGSDYKTTPLFTYEEGVEAMRAARDSSYRPPGG